MTTKINCRITIAGRSTRRGLAFGAAVTLLLAAADARADEAIKIGIPIGLSGANSVVAPSVVQAAQLAVAEINAKGGIMGKKVELAVADDGSGADGAVKAFNSLIFQQKVNVTHHHGDKRRAERGPSRRLAGQDCRSSTPRSTKAAPAARISMSTPGFPISRWRRSSTTSRRTRGRRRSSWSAATTPSAAGCWSSRANTSNSMAVRSSARNTCRWMRATGPR